MRFEGLPGEFSQHDFGQVDVRFDRRRASKRVHFFASRLKWSRWVEVTLVPNQTAETLVRTLADHFVAFGGVPLCAVFDRPKTVALKWRKDGEVTEWNPTFAYAALELGFTAEVCWPYRRGRRARSRIWWAGSRARSSSSAASATGGPRATARRSGCTRSTPSAPAAPPASSRRCAGSRSGRGCARCGSRPPDLALRIPVSVGPTAEVLHDGHTYAMPPEAAGLAGHALPLPRPGPDRGRALRGQPTTRQTAAGSVSRLPEHRAAHLAAISGKRGKRYLKRQQLFEVGESAVRFLTELVHRIPAAAGRREVDQLHELLQAFGPEAHRARLPRRARVGRHLGRLRRPPASVSGEHPQLELPRGAPASDLPSTRAPSTSTPCSSGSTSPTPAASGRSSPSTAEAEQWSYRDFLAVLCAEEIAHRQQTRLARAVRDAHFPFLKTIDDFDFSLQSTLRPQPCSATTSAPTSSPRAATSSCSARPAAARPTSPSPSPTAPSRTASTRCFTTAAALIDDLSAASRDGRLREALAHYLHPHVLVVDEVGYLTYGADAANVLFHVVNERHLKRRPMIFTTNKSPLDRVGRGPPRPGPRRGHRRPHPRARQAARPRRPLYRTRTCHRLTRRIQTTITLQTGQNFRKTPARISGTHTNLSLHHRATSRLYLLNPALEEGVSESQRKW